MRLLLPILCLALSWSVRGAVWNSPTVNYSDVSATIALAADGDEVDLPAGTATWTSIYSLTKSITLRGSGTNLTRIINNIPSSQGSGYNNGKGGALIEVHSTGTWRVTGIWFDGNGAAGGGGIGLEILGSSPNGRIDHCLFSTSPTYGVQTFAKNYGVCDHCAFNNNKVAFSCNMDNQSAWLRPRPTGTTSQWVIEDYTVTIDNSDPFGAANVGDGSYGSSYTWRYGYCTNSTSGFDVFVENHGNQGPPDFNTPLTAPSVLRSVVTMEVYFNQLDTKTANGFFSHRGGTLFGFGNTANVADPSSVLGTFGFAHGGTEEDGWRNGNAPFTQWPPYDGITNSYFWSETVNVLQPNGQIKTYVDAGFGLLFPGTTPCTGTFSSSIRCPNPASDGIFIQPNRDYFLHAPSTSFYKPLRYPHPRVLSDNDPLLAAPFALASPVDGGSVSTQPTLAWTASAGANAFTIEVATDYYFTHVVHSATVQTAPLSYPVPPNTLVTNTTYFWRVKALNNNGGVYSGTLNTAEIRSFTTGGTTPPVSQPPNTPTNLSPANGAPNVVLTPTLQGTPYSDPQASPQAGSEWFIYHAGTNVLDDFGGPNASYAVFPGTLTNSTTYTWQVRYRNSLNIYSALSALTTFTTTNSAPVNTNQPPATPSNVLPASGATGVSLTPTLVASAYSDPQASAQLNSQWLITHSGTNLYGNFGGVATSFTVPAGTLANSEPYLWQARYQNTLGLWSAYSNPTIFTTTNAAPPPTPLPPAQPVNALPADNATSVATAPTLVASTYIDPQASPQFASQWQVYLSQTGALIWDSGTNGPAATTINVSTNLLTGTVYTWTVRYKNSFSLWSPWSQSTAFTTIPVYTPMQPTNVSPIDGAVNVTLTPTLVASVYSDPNTPALAQQAAEWIIRSNQFAVLDHVAGPGTSYNVSAGVLTNNTPYTWLVRYQNSSNIWSPYSIATTFTTVPASPTPPPTNTVTVILNGQVVLSGKFISQ